MAKNEGKKVDEKVAAKKAQPKKAKVYTLKATMMLSHKGKLYGEGEVFEEADKEMAEQILAKGLATKV